MRLHDLLPEVIRLTPGPSGKIFSASASECCEHSAALPGKLNNSFSSDGKNN
ncbi:hypothetical protein ABL623_004726 [Salmonella enterica subsp. enterica serovar Newport]|nr:hypothetical protein [Salmonella enterica subsp. enterica serovar Newport]